MIVPYSINWSSTKWPVFFALCVLHVIKLIEKCKIFALSKKKLHFETRWLEIHTKALLDNLWNTFRWVRFKTPIYRRMTLSLQTIHFARKNVIYVCSIDTSKQMKLSLCDGCWFSEAFTDIFSLFLSVCIKPSRISFIDL